ncbi:unnamed protein product [Porites lobata]|uniref:Fibrinogen C-terminal domain-containing protein n=1 Tax=Porites lobata TaxID=104759 RepID=A0ABN8P9H1_9CNID|nr:unnamed protein product [Porites lobata]
MAVDGQSQQFHKRFNGFVGFYRGWKEYKNGFLLKHLQTGEFWLGKEKTHQLTEIPSYLCVEINTTFAGYRYTSYSNFTVTNEASNYTLFIGFYSGTATDELTYHSSRLLLLRTVIVTKREVTNVRGAWWYSSCYTGSSLNNNYRGNTYYAWNLLGSEMKLKPKQKPK